MVKLTVLYRTPANPAAFEDWYVGNLALMERLPGIIRRQANVVLGSPGGKSPFLRILELYFENFEALDRAMVSLEGRNAGADLVKFMGKNVDMIFSEVFEE